MSAVVVKTFFGHSGHDRWSIRRWDDGSFQVFYDNPYRGTSQPYEGDYHQVSGRFSTVEDAEAELFKNPALGPSALSSDGGDDD
jgi:hypothetical protein